MVSAAVEEAPVNTIPVGKSYSVTKILVELATPVAAQVATAVVVATMLGRSTEQVPKRIWLIAVPLEPTLTPKVAVVVPLSVVKVEEAVEMKPP